MKSKSEIVADLRSKAARSEFIIGAGAGIGLSAKCAVDGGADLVLVFNSGRYRMAGRGSTAGYLPFGDANAIVADMAGEIIPMSGDVPVIAGVCGTDPFKIMTHYLEDLGHRGYQGVLNFPTVGLIDGLFRQSLEETGLGWDNEVRMIKTAAELGLLTTPYVFTPEEGVQMASAGADVVVAHMGVTVKGTIGAKQSMSLGDAASRCQAIADAVHGSHPDVLVMCHGGPIAEPGDAQYIADHTTGIVGFYGASSTERIPSERAMLAKMQEFKGVTASQAS